MVKLLLTLVALLATPVFAQQSPKKVEKPAEPSPKPLAVPVPNVVLELPQIQRRPLVLPAGGWRFEPQPRARVEGVLGGFRIIEPTNPKFSTEAHFPAFIDEQINTLKSTFKLDDKTTRRLQVAAKGVVHRRQASQPAKKKPDQPVIFAGGNVIWLGDVVPTRDMSAEFQSRLGASKIWKRTLNRVLSEQQRKQWDNLNASKLTKRGLFVPAPRPPGIPVLNLPRR